MAQKKYKISNGKPFIFFVVVASMLLGACGARNQGRVTTTEVIDATLPVTIPESQAGAYEPTQVTKQDEPVFLEVTPEEMSTPVVVQNEDKGVTQTPEPTVGVVSKKPEFPNAGIEILSIKDVKHTAQAGAYWVRRNALIWSVVEPSEGARNWKDVLSLEKELTSISSHNMETILIVRGTPAWAQKTLGVHCGPMQADKIRAFATFMQDVVTRYSQPPYNVKYWELGNEPDVDPALVASDGLFGCWGDPSDPYYGGGYYAEMLKQVYPAIKSADPDAQILVGGLLLTCDPVNPPEVKGQSGVYEDCSPSLFLEGILRNGGGDYFDGVSFHAYDYYFDVLGKYGNRLWHSSWKTTGPVLFAKTAYLRNLLEEYGYPDKFLMNTEVAVLCGSTGDESPCQQQEWEDTKTYHLVQAYTAAAVIGLRANVWYCLTGWRGSELLDPYRNPLPAYQAFTINQSMLMGTIPLDRITMYEGVMGFSFEKDGKLLWVLWSLDGLDHTVPLGSTPLSINDAFGNSLPLLDYVTITLSPIYVKW